MQMGWVERSDIKLLVARWQRRGVGAGAQRNALAPLAAMFAGAVDDDDPANPCAGIRIQKTQTPTGLSEHEKALADDELANLRTYLGADQRFMVDFLTQTGLRLGECLELRWKDITGDVVHVRRAVYEGSVGEPDEARHAAGKDWSDARAGAVAAAERITVAAG